jgi:hypothetical protein
VFERKFKICAKAFLKWVVKEKILSHCQSLYMGRGNFGERKSVTDQVGVPPVGLAIGIRGETSPF